MFGSDFNLKMKKIGKFKENFSNKECINRDVKLKKSIKGEK